MAKHQHSPSPRRALMLAQALAAVHQQLDSTYRSGQVDAVWCSPAIRWGKLADVTLAELEQGQSFIIAAMPIGTRFDVLVEYVGGPTILRFTRK